MNISVLINDVRKKWKIYAIGYLIGYIWYLVSEGAPTWHYYFPIKVQCFGVSITLGFIFDEELTKWTRFVRLLKSLKYSVVMVILIVSAVLLQSLILLLTGYDISPLVGF